jgi:uncharacterized membrane protein/3-hydroxymyristoyl/3-hydroxydecanoyl-(acyl carrier protein) dehydratase
MLKALIFILAAIYPVLVFCSLVIFKIPLRYFSVFIIFVALVVFLGATSKKKDWFRLVSAGLLGAAGLACFLSASSFFLKLYPVLMNAVFLGAFGFTLFSPPTMIFRFAVLQDKTIRGAPWEKKVEAYCRTVTLVWCGFFILNGGIAVWTVASGSDTIWSLYNGGISYILMGTLFAGEFVIRRITDKKIRASTPSENRSADILDSRQLEGITLREQSPGRAALEFSVPPGSDYFNEHFPALKILPAVAQFEMVLRFANRYLGTPLRMKKAKRIKFSSLVRPGVPLRMELVLAEDGLLNFVISSPDGNTVYSSGSCVLESGTAS